MKNHFDLLVIGAGSGGLAAAQQAAAFGATVGIIEKNLIGGTCVNVGCVPKKMTWFAGETAGFFQAAHAYGFQNKNPQFVFDQFVQARQRYLKKLNTIYRQRLKQHKITYIQGSAKFIDPHSLQVANKHYSAKQIIIATGCSPNIPTLEGAEFAFDSDDFFALKALPQKIAIIGGGYIAMELSSILNKLGVDVHLLVRDSAPLKQFDPMIADGLLELIKLTKINLHKEYEVEKISRNTQKKLTLHCNRHRKLTQFDAVLFAIGRHPCTAALDLHLAGVKLNKGNFISTNKWETTNVAHIFAIGDVTGKKMQTPVAVAAGRQLAKRLFGAQKKAFLDYRTVPTVIFTHPPAASVGLTEQEALKKYGQRNLDIYTTQFVPLYYGIIKRKIPSSIKLIALKKSQKVIGCHIIDKHADEIIQGFAVAMKMGATKYDFDATIGVHPTSAEELLTLKAVTKKG